MWLALNWGTDNSLNEGLWEGRGAQHKPSKPLAPMEPPQRVMCTYAHTLTIHKRQNVNARQKGVNTDKEGGGLSEVGPL